MFVYVAVFKYGRHMHEARSDDNVATNLLNCVVMTPVVTSIIITLWSLNLQT